MARGRGLDRTRRTCGDVVDSILPQWLSIWLLVSLGTGCLLPKSRVEVNESQRSPTQSDGKESKADSGSVPPAHPPSRIRDGGTAREGRDVPSGGTRAPDPEAAGKSSMAPTTQGESQEPPQLGAACKRDADCTGGYVCDAELRMATPVPGAPEGRIEQIVFLGGSCTPTRATEYDNTGPSCDPTMPIGSQGCGSDGVCDAVARSQDSIVVGCRKSCDPGAAQSGCRKGYECGYTDRYCSEGCQTDTDCRVRPDAGTNMLSYDSSSNVRCDSAMARCTHAGGPQASGQSCTRDDDCPEDGVCVADGVEVAGQRFPGGHCTRSGCEFPAHACDHGTVCEALRPWLAEAPTEPLCFQRCKIGAEAVELRTGTEGHGEGCRPGYRCHYNGGSGSDSGVCVGGNYNAITTNNIGADCKTNADCYSPYGLGYCLIYQVSSEVLPGFCTLFDCAVPGLPTDLCGANNECVSTGDGDETNCQHQCQRAEECAKGFACTDNDEDPSTPRNCIPPCLADSDCRAGEKCVLISATGRSGLCRVN